MVREKVPGGFPSHLVDCEPSGLPAALHLSLVALEVGPGDEVITSPITWPSTANVIIHTGATPVFADLDPATLNIDPEAIEAAITERTKAIIPVHMAGFPCDLDRIHAVAQGHGLAVVEDAAHALGAEYKGEKIGAISEFTCFSFYPIKNITTIEGGALATNNAEWAETARLYSLHGISRDAWKRYQPGGSLHWELLAPGFKYNMSDVQASLGIHQLPRLDSFIATRRRHAERYREAFAALPEIETFFPEANGLLHAHHLFIIALSNGMLNIDRDGLMEALKAENIATGVHFRSLHIQPYYRETFGYRPEDFPRALDLSNRILSLPSTRP
ncbi:MAG: DegT/DnrJ/EryC1/StrS family aminotransferase [Nitrospinae bacterium]|nr:DegT/DnrJ/EryC1/StrS family aminotransferase [Nitrospinota bacterium]